MPLYLIERRFAEQLEFTPEAVQAVQDVNAVENVRWLVSFLTADKLKTYCVYEAASADAILAAARRANVPADTIVEVEEVNPTALG